VSLAVTALEIAAAVILMLLGLLSLAWRFRPLQFLLLGHLRVP
jgi:hypothetical protein